MNLNDYIKPELVVLIPVLYIIGMMMKNTKKIIKKISLIKKNHT